MALIMIRHNTTSGAPPLPARQPSAHHSGQSGKPVKSGRSQSVDHTVHHVHCMRQFSDGTTAEIKTSDDLNFQRRAGPISRKDFETKSFIDRNTAKVFSNPDSYRGGAGNPTQVRRPVDHVEYPVDENCPPPPPISTLPKKSTAAGDRRNAPPPPTTSPPARKSDPALTSPPGRPPKSGQIDPPPPPPPGRPPKTSDSVPIRPPKSLPVEPERLVKTMQSPVDQAAPGRPVKTPTGPPLATSPPGRPPKIAKSPSFEIGSEDINPSMYDLEKRFCFHSLDEFPPPEPMSGMRKTKPSMTRSMRRIDQKERMGYL